MYVMSYRKKRHKMMTATLNCVSKASGHGPNPGCVVDPRVIHSYVTNVSSGYRKITTGEYVCNKYRSMCYGKGLYYQPSITVVHLGLADAIVLGASAWSRWTLTLLTPMNWTGNRLITSPCQQASSERLLLGWTACLPTSCSAHCGPLQHQKRQQLRCY